MADLASLQTQLDALKRAYRSGVRAVEHDNKRVTYASGEEMRAAIASLQAEIGQITGNTTSTVGVVRSTKGY